MKVRPNRVMQVEKPKSFEGKYDNHDDGFKYYAMTMLNSTNDGSGICPGSCSCIMHETILVNNQHYNLFQNNLCFIRLSLLATIIHEVFKVIKFGKIIQYSKSGIQ